jgi:hypothetical protein
VLCDTSVMFRHKMPRLCQTLSQRHDRRKHIKPDRCCPQLCVQPPESFDITTTDGPTLVVVQAQTVLHLNCGSEVCALRQRIVTVSVFGGVPNIPLLLLALPRYWEYQCAQGKIDYRRSHRYSADRWSVTLSKCVAVTLLEPPHSVGVTGAQISQPSSG